MMIPAAAIAAPYTHDVDAIPRPPEATKRTR